MIQIILDLDTGIATLVNPATVKLGSQEPVQIITQSGGQNAPPAATPYFQLALGAQTTSPTVLAYTDSFVAQNFCTYTGWLDCTDSRLATFMTGLGSATVNCELSFTVSGELQVSPNFPVNVQPRIVSGPTTSMGTPSYYTTTQSDAKYAEIDPATGSVMIGTNARLFPLSNGCKLQFSVDGTTWQDGPSWVAS